MSKARSPREVCSTTIGMFGLMSAPSGDVSVLGAGRSRLAAGGPQRLRLVAGGLVLVRRPDRLARLCKLRCDRLHLGRDAIDGLLHAEVEAHAVCAARLDECLDVVLVLALLAELGADVVVGDLDPE